MTHRFLKKIKNLFSFSKDKHRIENTEEVRHDFRERYFFFKQLLAANNSALEGFARIESLLNSSTPFGMSQVKANTTAVLVSVFRMIRKLERLAPGKYASLMGSYDSIEKQINMVLKQDQSPGDDRLIIDLSRIDKTMSDSVGQKMANLGEMKNVLGLDVPQGFVITAAACDFFFRQNNLHTEISRIFKTRFSNDIESMHDCSSEVQQIIMEARMPRKLAEQIEKALSQVLKVHPAGLRLALRSSALGEDSLDASFAGQYKTLLNIEPADIVSAYKEILASKYGVTAIQYRLNRGFRDEDIDMCVGCLAMVDASSGGVAYTCHPFELHDDAIHIQSTWGLPKAVVDGTVNGDLFVIERSQQMAVRHTDIQKKNKKYICHAEHGECRFEFVDDMQLLPSLTEQQAFSIAEDAVRIEAHYGVPQDIEWAIVTEGTKSKIYFLQSRPLKNRGKKAQKTVLPDIEKRESLITDDGITASPGAAAGPTFIVDGATDLTRFPEGGVLVTRQALPKWAPLLGRASALVTEKGGFAGHLANVAREFGVPAIFGVENACRLLSEKLLVTVDADDCKVYQGKVTEILDLQPEKKNLMDKSPVHNTLKKCARLITPLNLLNPDAADFKPQKCRTLHDITRFIHEKSVAEMFNFGKNYGFDEVSSKQLFDQVPMQWWVMNLDDGFNKKVTGRYVHLDDISCVPMLAIWQGIVAVPWEGPPPLDKKGLMSVMFHATANTALNTGVKSKYSQRNYFMISKHYCCLNSRLGFHFTTLEAFVGARDSENYISFRFQGGAADQSRRLKRVRLIADFLSKYGFKVTLKQDHLNARLKGCEKQFMIDRLKLIGYLTIHTRQLDMVTANKSIAAKYYNKFKTDIESAFNIHMQSEAAQNQTEA